MMRWPRSRRTLGRTRAALDAVSGVVWLPRAILYALQEEADRTAPNETGGLLLGYWARPPGRADLGGEAVVTAVVGPGPAAVHSGLSFVPDYDYQERELARLYAESERRWAYLGDWHSHPDGPGVLSDRDVATLSRIARDPEARAPYPLMAILAGGTPWVPHAWVGTRQMEAAWWRRQFRAERLQVRIWIAPLGASAEEVRGV